MIWQLILLIIIFLLIIPIPIKFRLNFNILRLSGEVFIKVFFIKYKVRVRFRGGYVYIIKNSKARREKLSSKNYNVVFITQFARQLYFRLILQSLRFVSEEGYYNNAMITAIGSSVIDIISKCLYARILHNKKSAHIFIQNEAKYNQDCLNIKVESEIRISLFDLIYSLVNSYFILKGEKYERANSIYEQDKGID